MADKAGNGAITADNMRPTLLGRDFSYCAAFALASQEPHVLELQFFAGERQPQAGLVTVTFFSEKGTLLPSPYYGTLQSSLFPAYLYLSASGTGTANTSRFRLTPPAGAAGMAIGVRAWKTAALSLKGRPKLYDPRGKISTEMPVPKSVPSAASPTTWWRDRIFRESMLVWSRRISNRLFKQKWKVSFHCHPGDLLEFSGGFVASKNAGMFDATLSLSFYDAHGQALSAAVPGFSASGETQSYQYLRRGGYERELCPTIIFRAPEGATSGAAFITPGPAATLRVKTAPTVKKTSWNDVRERIEPENAVYCDIRSLLIEARRQGEYELVAGLNQRLYAMERSARHELAARQTAGVVTELNPNWLPSVISRATPQEVRIDSWRVGHLLKAIAPDETSGGAVRSWNIMKFQAREGWAPIACLPISSIRAPNVRDGVHTSLREGVCVTQFQFRAFDRKNIAPPRLLELEATLVAREMERHRCNLVHASSGFKGFDNALKGAAIARYLNLPFIYEVRSFHEQSWASPNESVENAPLTRARMRQEERCMSIADAVVTISEAMAQELVRRGIDRDKIFVVPNAVDLRFLDIPPERDVEGLRERYNLKGCTVIGSISNLSPREGHADMLEAFARLSDAENRLRCLIVGEGREQSALRARALRLGLADRVIFAGELDHSRIQACYRLIDIFVIPRKPDYASAFVTPMKAIEASAMARPIVMSDQPVSVELLGKEERGLLYRSGDVDELSHRLKRLIDHPDWASQLGAKGRVWVQKERVWDSVIQLYGNVYAHALRNISNI